VENIIINPKIYNLFARDLETGRKKRACDEVLWPVLQQGQIANVHKLCLSCHTKSTQLPNCLLQFAAGIMSYFLFHGIKL
jgi:hypothetical protein